MNYIQQLKENNENLKIENDNLKIGISNIYKYLQLPKFHKENMVNISDIYLRLDEIR